MLEELLSSPYYFLMGSAVVDNLSTAYNVAINGPGVEKVRFTKKLIQEQGIFKGLVAYLPISIGVLAGLSYGAHSLDVAFNLDDATFNIQNVFSYGLGGFKYLYCGGIHLLAGTVGLCSREFREEMRGRK